MWDRWGTRRQVSPTQGKWDYELRTERRDLLPPEDFFCECGHVGKLRFIIKRWQAVGSDDTIDFLLCLVLGGGVHQHGKEEGQ